MKTAMIAAVAIIVAFSIGSLVYTAYGSGTLVFKMTDPPTDWGPVEDVYINYTNIQIHRADPGNQSGWILTGISGALNLLEIVDFNKTIGQLSLQAGLYDFVRFNVTNAIVTYDGVKYSAFVENGMLNVPIIPEGVRVRAGNTASMLIDISVKVTGSTGSVIGNFKLVPAATASLT